MDCNGNWVLKAKTNIGKWNKIHHVFNFFSVASEETLRRWNYVEKLEWYPKLSEGVRNEVRRVYRGIIML